MFRVLTVAAFLVVAGSTVSYAQAPFPGAVQYCPPGAEPGWAPAGNPLIALYPCALSNPFDLPTQPSAGRRDTFSVGHYYRCDAGWCLGQYWFVASVAQMSSGRFFYVLEGVSAPTCGQLTAWPADRPSPRYTFEVSVSELPAQPCTGQGLIQ